MWSSDQLDRQLIDQRADSPNSEDGLRRDVT